MPTIGEVYNPLIEMAKDNNPAGHQMLAEVGRAIFMNNLDKCQSLDKGIAAAKRNLNYYCQYFSSDVAAKTKTFYGLGEGFQDLLGNKWP